MQIDARVYKFGNDVDTDQIVPGRYLTLVKPDEIAAHVMEGADPTFVSRFTRGSVMVGGRNFGCGSSREHAPIGLKAAGVACVVAESFGRIFYRNAINIGLPLLRCEGISALAQEGDRILVDPASGEVTLPGRNATLHGERLSAKVMELIECGGLVNYVRERLARGETNA